MSTIKKRRNLTRKNKRHTEKNTPATDKLVPCRSAYKEFEKEYSMSKEYLLKHTTAIHSELLHIFRRNNQNTTVSPKDDFYTYINKEWLLTKNATEDQKYIVQLDNYRLTQYKVLNELDEIIKTYVKTHDNDTSKQLVNFRKSLEHGFTTKDFEKHLKKYMTLLDDMRSSRDNLWKWLAYTNRYHMTAMGSPIVVTLQNDDKDTGRFRFYVGSPQVSLIDLTIYEPDTGITDTDNYRQKIRKRYLKYLQATSDVLVKVDPSYGFNPLHVLEIETLIVMSTRIFDETIEESNDAYNKLTHTKAYEMLYGFNWKELMADYGCKKTPPFFLTYANTYIGTITKILRSEWNSEKWRSYWIYIYAKYLTRAYEKSQMIAFDFYGDYLYGMEQPASDRLREVVLMSIAFNKFLSDNYVKKYSIPEHSEYTYKFCKDLIEVYKRIISRNKWLSPKTKQFALKKLEYMNIVIGSAKTILEDPPLEYSSTDYWENLKRVMYWRTDQKILLEGQPIIDIPEIDYTQFPPKFVGKQSYIVNAMYTPSENSIYIPLAYLQKPFIDLDERGIEYNLANIGFTLGHEMSHALDDMGSMFDYKGNLFDWWTENDKRIFKKKQNNIIQQYEIFAKRDGIIFDARPSVGEDLADISGIAICQEYLRDFQDKNEDIAPIRKLSYLAFFVYFAYQQRQKISKRAINAQLHTNPHPLDKYRTNIPLSRLKLFKAIYNVIKTDGMYWPTTDTIW
jgi:putative endopeptidase